MLKPNLLLFSLMLCTLLSSCATTSERHLEPQHNQAPTSDLVAEKPVRPFPTETLYHLLVAEFAGVRNLPDIALENYVEQALATRDKGITARAADIALFLQDMPELFKVAELWIQLEPENLQARQMAVLSLAQAGRHIEAFSHANFLLENKADESLIMLADFSESATDESRQQLLELYNNLALKQPDNVSIAIGKALILQNLKKYDEALDVADKTKKVAPNSEPLDLIRAQLHLQKGDRSAAITILEKALEEHPDSKPLRRQYVRLISADNPAETHHQLTLLLQNDPADVDLMFNLGLTSIRIGKREQAREIFTRLTGIPSLYPAAHFQLARMAEDEDRIETALQHFRQVRKGPQLVEAAARLSQLMVTQNKTQDAQLYLQQLRLEQPSSAILLFQVEAEMLLTEKKLGDALSTLDNALNTYPDNISLLYSRSMVFEENDDFASSEKDLRTILALDEDNAMAMNALGYTMTLHTERYQEAHQLITRALEISPEDPAIIDSLGWVLYHMGQHQEAIRYLRQAISQFPDAEIAAHLGEVLWVAGEAREAERVWRSILDLDPDNSLILETMQRLKTGP